MANPCKPHLILNTPAACPVISLAPLWRWVTNQKYLVAVLFCGLGGALLSYGGKHYMASIAIMATLNAIFVSLMLLFGKVMPNITPQAMVWWIVILSVGVGCGQGYGAYHWPRGGIFIVCLYVGTILGVVVYSTFIGGYDFIIGIETTGLDALDVRKHEAIKLWASVGICSTIAVIAGLVYFDYAVIVSSAIAGSFMIVRGLSLVLGGYPNEFEIYEA